MYDDNKINDLKAEYNELVIKETQLENQLKDVQSRKIMIQREIARNLSPATEAKTLSLLYEQRQTSRKK